MPIADTNVCTFHALINTTRRSINEYLITFLDKRRHVTTNARGMAMIIVRIYVTWYKLLVHTLGEGDGSVRGR